MSAAPQTHVAIRAFSCLTPLISRLDRRAVSLVLKAADIQPQGALGVALRRALDARVAECRDLFVLRGVHPKRATVLQMAGRSLARDADEAAGLDCVTAGGGAYVLAAIASLIEQRAGHPPRTDAERLAERLARVAVLDGIASQQAAGQAVCDEGPIVCALAPANELDLALAA